MLHFCWNFLFSSPVFSPDTAVPLPMHEYAHVIPSLPGMTSSFMSRSVSFLCYSCPCHQWTAWSSCLFRAFLLFCVMCQRYFFLFFLFFYFYFGAKAPLPTKVIDLPLSEFPGELISLLTDITSSPVTKKKIWLVMGVISGLDERTWVSHPLDTHGWKRPHRHGVSGC